MSFLSHHIGGVSVAIANCFHMLGNCHTSAIGQQLTRTVTAVNCNFTLGFPPTPHRLKCGACLNSSLDVTMQGTYGAASAATPPVMVPQAQLQQHSMPQQTAWRYPEAHPGMAAAAAEILSSPGYPQHQQPHPSPRQLQLEHLSPRQQHTSPRQQLPSPRQPQPGLYQDQSAVVAGRGAVDFEIPLVDVPYIGSPPPGGVSANHRGTGEIRAEVAWQSGRRASLDSPAKGRRSSVDSPANSRHGSGDVAQLTRQISGVGGPLQGRRGSGGATGVPERHSSGEVLTQGGSGAFGSQIKRFGLEGGGGSGNLGSTPPWSANRSTFPTFRHISEEVSQPTPPLILQGRFVGNLIVAVAVSAAGILQMVIGVPAESDFCRYTVSLVAERGYDSTKAMLKEVFHAAPNFRVF